MRTLVEKFMEFDKKHGWWTFPFIISMVMWAFFLHFRNTYPQEVWSIHILGISVFSHTLIAYGLGHLGLLLWAIAENPKLTEENLRRSHK